MVGRGEHDLDSVPKMCNSLWIRHHASISLSISCGGQNLPCAARAFSEHSDKLKPLPWLLFQNNKALGRFKRQDVDQNAMQESAWLLENMFASRCHHPLHESAKAGEHQRQQTQPVSASWEM